MMCVESGNQSGVQLWNSCTMVSSPVSACIRTTVHMILALAMPQNH